MKEGAQAVLPTFTGASVLRGLEGFGRFPKIHTSRFLSLTEDLPLSVVLIDERP